MVEIAVDGAPTTGKSSLIAAVSSASDVVPEVATFLPARVRTYPETAAAHRRRVFAEFETLTYRAERYGGDGDTVCEMSVVSTVALASLLGDLVDGADPAGVVASALDRFGDAVRHPDVFVFLTAPPAVVQSRWDDRSMSSTFWSDPAVVAYLNEFYRRVAARVPSVVIDTDAVSHQTAVERLRAAPERVTDDPVELCGVLRRVTRHERPSVDWTRLEDERYRRPDAEGQHGRD